MKRGTARERRCRRGAVADPPSNHSQAAQDKLIEDERKKQRSIAFKQQLKVRMAKDRLRTAIEVRRRLGERRASTNRPSFPFSRSLIHPLDHSQPWDRGS